MFKWIRQNTTCLAPIQEKTPAKDLFNLEGGIKSNEKIEMKDLIASNYVLLTKIGHGAYGDIILSYNLLDKCEVIVKKEKKFKNQRQSLLYIESKLFQSLLDISPNQDITGKISLPQKKIKGFPKFYGYGETPEFFYLIMEFLGPNLGQLLNYCGKKKFTLGTVCLIAMQILNRIEFIHKKHFLHRDIKPENICIGNEEETNIIFLIDFGLSKRFKDNKTHQHIAYKEGRSFVGTSRYASINDHLGIELSRRDDLMSIGYILIYLIKGVLPWQGLKGENKMAKIMQKKIQISNEILCSGLPNEFVHYLNYCKNLKFEERPDYEFLKGLFGRLLGLVITNFNIRRNELIFDWCFKDVDYIWKKYIDKEDFSETKKEKTVVDNKASDDEKEEDKEKEKGRGFIDSLMDEPSNEKEDSEDDDEFEEEENINKNDEENDNLKLKKNSIITNSVILKKQNFSLDEYKNISKGNMNSKLNSRLTSSSLGNYNLNSLKEEEDEDDSCETIREEFDTKKIYTDIKEIKEEQKVTEDVDKIIFKIIGKSLDNYVGTTQIDDKNVDELDEYQDTVEPLENFNKNIISNFTSNKSLTKFNHHNSKNLLKKDFSFDESFVRKNAMQRIFGKEGNKKSSAYNLLITQKPIKSTEIKIFNKKKRPSFLRDSSVKGVSSSKILDKSFLDQVKLKKENLTKIKKGLFTKDYEVIGEIGTGSYGSVKKVRHKKLKEVRAMKVILKKNETSQTEIDILRKISHPHVVNIFDIYEDTKKYYIMMELFEGGELFEAIAQQGTFSEFDCAHIMKQILSAVNYLHSKNIMHRDIKPENIMLTHKLTKKNKKYEVKLIDFGTAKIFEKGVKETKFIGTSYYIAPDVIKESYDEKCDIWSSGVIMYILLCGYPPFNGNSTDEIYNSIQNSQPYFHGEDWKDITPEAIDLLQNMLNKKSNKRFSAQQCINHKWFKLLSQDNKSNINNFGKKLQMKVINKMNDFVKENRLKQAVLQFISNQFNLKKEEEDLQALFKEFDLKKTGEISKDIFYKKLSELYGEIEGKEICDKIFERLDLDGSGEISYDEFLSAMIDGKKVLTEDRLEKAFKMFDKDGNGLLSIPEIVEVFGGDASYWTKIIEEVDSNNDGEVDFSEFKQLMGVFNDEEQKKKIGL